MGAQIVGYETLPEGIRHGLEGILAPFGASIVVTETEIATSGLVIATRMDMVTYNETLEEKQRPSFVGRCWGMPLTKWLRYREALANPDSVPSYRVRQALKEPESVQGFTHLFIDGSHMNVNVLRTCLNDGMTDRMEQMGPCMNEFLTGFADSKL